MSAISTQQAILNTPAAVFQAGITSSLQFYAQQNTNNLQTEMIDFLRSLSTVSITCKRKLAAIDPQDFKQIKQLFAELAQNDLNNIQREIEYNLQLAQQQVKQQQASYAQQISAALGYQNDVAQKITTARSDKLLYDYVGSLGALIESKVLAHYVTQVDAKNSVRGFKFVPQNNANSYEKFLQEQYGSDATIFPGGAAPKPK